MNRILVLVTALLAATALAGCADGGGAPATNDQTLADDQLVATDTTGVIRGVVVDAAIVPIAGATVTIEAVGATTESAEDGSFGFTNLEPGTYFLKIDRIGYNGVQTSVEVVAGVDRPAITRIQLEANPSEVPYLQQTQYRANLRCGLAIPRGGPIGAFGCSLVRGTEDIVGENNAEMRQFDIIPTWFQTEMYWESSQRAGNGLILDIAHCCENHDIGDNSTASGASPLTAWATKAEFLDHDHDSNGGYTSVVADGIEIRVFPSGNTDIEDATGQRLGVILEQEVEWISTEFYNFEPPEGWTFLDAGLPTVPS